MQCLDDLPGTQTADWRLSRPQYAFALDLQLDARPGCPVVQHAGFAASGAGQSGGLCLPQSRQEPCLVAMAVLLQAAHWALWCCPAEPVLQGAAVEPAAWRALGCSVEGLVEGATLLGLVHRIRDLLLKRSSQGRPHSGVETMRRWDALV